METLAKFTSIYTISNDDHPSLTEDRQHEPSETLAVQPAGNLDSLPRERLDEMFAQAEAAKNSKLPKVTNFVLGCSDLTILFDLVY